MPITVDSRKFDQFVRAASSDTEPAVIEIYTNSKETAEYWRILEHGGKPSGPWKSPGKRTRRGKGGRIFSSQAPDGFIMRNLKTIIGYLRDALAAKFSSVKRPLTTKELRDVALGPAQRATDLIRQSVPTDSGKLRNSIRWREVLK